MGPSHAYGGAVHALSPSRAQQHRQHVPHVMYSPQPTPHSAQMGGPSPGCYSHGQQPNGYANYQATSRMPAPAHLAHEGGYGQHGQYTSASALGAQVPTMMGSYTPFNPNGGRMMAGHPLLRPASSSPRRSDANVAGVGQYDLPATAVSRRPTTTSPPPVCSPSRAVGMGGGGAQQAQQAQQTPSDGGGTTSAYVPGLTQPRGTFGMAAASEYSHYHIVASAASSWSVATAQPQDIGTSTRQRKPMTQPMTRPMTQPTGAAETEHLNLSFSLGTSAW